MYLYPLPDLGCICDCNGYWLPENVLPDKGGQKTGDWLPFEDCVQFETAKFLFSRCQMSSGRLNQLLKLWKASLGDERNAPFENHDHLYTLINAIPHGLNWESFTMSYLMSDDEEDVRPSWMDAEFEVWHRNVLEVVKSIIGNPDFNGEFDYSPYQYYVGESHQFWDLMSGNWAWRQAASKFVISCLRF